MHEIGHFEVETDRDRAEWARLRAFCAEWGDRAFSRDALIGGHVTASAFVLCPEGVSVLLTHHRKLDRWLQLGGHCDGIADTCFVAQKEAYEESGLSRIDLLRPEVLDVDIHEIPARGAEPAHLHYDVRFLFQARSRAFRVSSESLDLAWVPLSELAAYTDAPSVLRLRDKAVAWGAAQV
ncbi:NUDIX hydrolase [Tropicibacter naphthalenivorans]|nr:NUDIX hydrolase [Tropicibacter naphthalenivorans]